jgi:hypothetical protein
VIASSFYKKEGKLGKIFPLQKGAAVTNLLFILLLMMNVIRKQK